MTSFPSGSLRPVGVKADASVAASVTPQTIYDIYQTDNSGSSGSKLGSQAVVSI
jgi:hypothetical protein